MIEEDIQTIERYIYELEIKLHDVLGALMSNKINKAYQKTFNTT